jgi:hypothetical protein
VGVLLDLGRLLSSLRYIAALRSPDPSKISLFSLLSGDSQTIVFIIFFYFYFSNPKGLRRLKYFNIGSIDRNPAFSSQPADHRNDSPNKWEESYGAVGSGGSSKRRDNVVPGNYQPVKAQQ